jgi:transcription initiation factor TFIIE subunit beta
LEEFREMWHSLQTPLVHDLPIELQEAGLTSSSLSNLSKPAQTHRKPKKKGGRGGKVKITNTHLKDLGIDLSKDYLPATAAKK